MHALNALRHTVPGFESLGMALLDHSLLLLAHVFDCCLCHRSCCSCCLADLVDALLVALFTCPWRLEPVAATPTRTPIFRSQP